MIDIARIDEHRIPELVALFRAEWWAADRPLEQARTLVRNSDRVIGLVDETTDRLVAFARMLTDRAYFALCWT